MRKSKKCNKLEEQVVIGAALGAGAGGAAGALAGGAVGAAVGIFNGVAIGASTYHIIDNKLHPPKEKRVKMPDRYAGGI